MTPQRPIQNTDTNTDSNPSGKPEVVEVTEAQKSHAALMLSLQRIFEHWKATCNKPKAKLVLKRKTKVLARLKEGYSEDEIKRAIDHCSKSEFNNGGGDGSPSLSAA